MIAKMKKAGSMFGKTSCCGGTATLAKPAVKKATIQTIEFKFLAPLSKSVAVAGDFNKWNAKKNTLKPSKKGLWSTSIKLKSGRYQYRYVVDGKWENDNQRQTELIDNGLGQLNNVIVVG